MDFQSEEPDDMSHTYLVQWTIKPKIAPRPWLACNRCRAARPFEPSGKTRLNANGRRLDAWLIYRCCSCDSTWNRPIFERRHIRDIDPHTLNALQTNDEAWIEKVSFDLDGLRRDAGQIEEFSEVHVQKTILNPAAESSPPLEIVLDLAMKTSCERSGCYPWNSAYHASVSPYLKRQAASPQHHRARTLYGDR